MNQGELAIATATAIAVITEGFAGAPAIIDMHERRFTEDDIMDDHIIAFGSVVANVISQSYLLSVGLWDPVNDWRELIEFILAEL